MLTQEKFDLMIGRLDRILSEMVRTSKLANCEDACIMDAENMQTLKHHAEDMIGAGQKILDCLSPHLGLVVVKDISPEMMASFLRERTNNLRLMMGFAVTIKELKDMPINDPRCVWVPLPEYNLCVVRFVD